MTKSALPAATAAQSAAELSGSAAGKAQPMTKSFAPITVEDFERAQRETERLCHELDIANADHIVLWLEAQLDGHPGPLAYIACRILDAHEAALEAAEQSGRRAMRDEAVQVVRCFPVDEEAPYASEIGIRDLEIATAIQALTEKTGEGA